ncbi:ergothioneine biosynthesis protein EgtB [Roseateles albus]|uniref:Ergothioneine biosynthesis protein EgtB n=1 Tax=Roseateles albus TaxID=2987525 RepID=A0ABT5KIT1_9BURK|nr:ergothioneine biosynthesis protein EgtB [Roseateles albus]MDC8773847.1 ergothioneine biosynthesis protein EgtB [Roseateles albus]
MAPAQRSELLIRLQATRRHTEHLAAPLSPEDQALQSMPDASPTKWHQAHTTWFFETLVLRPWARDYQVFDARFAQLFNSYYESLGARHPRPQRGLLSRPALSEIQAYRAHVDRALVDLVLQADADSWAQARPLLELGLQHEQQHQELILSDILHAFSLNPLAPAYRAPVHPAKVPTSYGATTMQWLTHPGGLVSVGAPADGFSFDNEGPRHAVQVTGFEIASRLVNCGEFAAFIEDGGYLKAGLWLADGWALAQAQGWQQPSYWRKHADGSWRVFGLAGEQALDPQAPVMQLSFYEAAAYAEWAGARLPTEFEWEAAAADLSGLSQLDDQAWQWTHSAYHPYPGFRPWAGAVGEYNGKFMVGQMVLRGGSLATPRGHARPSYRNFFPPHVRWQFSGLRLARDLSDSQGKT